MAEAGAAEPDVGAQLVTRIGAALVAPKQALEACGRHIGKTPGDAALLLVLAFVAIDMVDVVSGAWMMIDGHFGPGMQMLLSQLARVASAPLVFLVAGGVGISLLAGHKRSLGADFDLACVAFVPVIVVEVAVALVFAAVGFVPDPIVARVVVVCAYAWGGVVLVLGLKQARSRTVEAAP